MRYDMRRAQAGTHHSDETPVHTFTASSLRTSPSRFCQRTKRQHTPALCKILLSALSAFGKRRSAARSDAWACPACLFGQASARRRTKERASEQHTQSRIALRLLRNGELGLGASVAWLSFQLKKMYHALAACCSQVSTNRTAADEALIFVPVTCLASFYALVCVDLIFAAHFFAEHTQHRQENTTPNGAISMSCCDAAVSHRSACLRRVTFCLAVERWRPVCFPGNR